jgi:hypothetical protein
VRCLIVRVPRRLAVALSMLLLMAAACAPPKTTQVLPSPSPSPSPSPEPTPVAVTAPAFHSGEVTVAYASVSLAATGGTPPYQWSVGGGALPGGLTLAADGTVSGVPTAAGTFNFTAHAADTGGRSADSSGSIRIVPAPSASLSSACAQHCSVEQGCDSTCGPFGAISDGTPPYTAAIQGGYVPKGVGVTVSGSTLAMAGTFTSPAKFWQFTVLVTDSLGATTTITPTFYVYPHLALAGGSCDGGYGGGCKVSLAYSGGTPGGTPAVQITSIAANTQGCYPSNPGSQPPAGYTMSASGGVVTITIPGNIGSGYGAIWTLSLTDQSPCTASTRCSAAPATVSIKVQCS